MAGGGAIAPQLEDPPAFNGGPALTGTTPGIGAPNEGGQMGGGFLGGAPAFGGGMPGIGAPSEPGQGLFGGGTNPGPGTSMPGIGVPPIGGGGPGVGMTGGGGMPGGGFGPGHGPAPIAGGMPGSGGAPGMGGGNPGVAAPGMGVGMQGPGQGGGMPGIGAPGFQGPNMGGGGGFGGGMPGVGGGMGPGFGPGLPGRPGMGGGGMGGGPGGGMPGGGGGGGGRPGGGGGPGGGGNMPGMPGGPGGQRPGQGGGWTTQALGEESGGGMGGGNSGPTTRAIGEESGGGMGGSQSGGWTTYALGEESGGSMGGGSAGNMGGGSGPTTRALGEESGGGMGGGLGGGQGNSGMFTTQAIGEESGGQMGGGGFKGFPGFPGLGGGGSPGMGGGNTGPTTRAIGEESGGGMGGMPGVGGGMGPGLPGGPGGGGNMPGIPGSQSGQRPGQGIGGGGGSGPTTRALGEESGGQMGGGQQGGGFTGPGGMNGMGGPGASAPMVPSMGGGEGESGPQSPMGGIGPAPVGSPLGGMFGGKPERWSTPSSSPSPAALSPRERTEQFANRIRDRWRRAGQEEMAAQKPIYDAGSPDGNSIGRRSSSDANTFPLSDARKAALNQSDRASVDRELQRRQLDPARMGATYNRNNDALNYLLDRARYGKRIPTYLNDLAQKSPNWDMERMKGTSPIHQVDSLREQKKRSDVVRPSRNAVDNQPKIMASGGGGGGFPPMLLSPPTGGNAAPSISPQRAGGRSYGSDIILPSGQQAAGANLGTGGSPRYSPPQAPGSVGYGNDIIMPPTSPASGLIGNKSPSPSVPSLPAGQPYGNDAIMPSMQRGSGAPAMAVPSAGPATASPLGGPAQVPSQTGVPQSPPQLPVYSGNAGRKSGIPLGSGQYDYSTMVGSLGQDAQRALDEYNAAVAQRDDLIRRLYEQRRKNTIGFQGNFGADVLGQFQNRADIANDIASRIGASALQNTKDLFKQRRAGILSSAVNRGLGNTTILDSLLQGATREESKALNDVLDTIAQRRLGTYLGTSGDTLNAQMALGGQKTGLLAGLSKDFVDYLERINPTPPDLGMVADLARKAGLGGVGVPTKDVPFPKPQPFPFPVNNSYLVPVPMAPPQQPTPPQQPPVAPMPAQSQSTGGDTMIYISPSMARARGIDVNNPPPGVMVTPDGGPPKGSNSQRITIGGGGPPATQAPTGGYPNPPGYPGAPSGPGGMGGGQGVSGPGGGLTTPGGMWNIGLPGFAGLPGIPGTGGPFGWPGVPFPWNPGQGTGSQPTSPGGPGSTWRYPGIPEGSVGDGNGPAVGGPPEQVDQQPGQKPPQGQNQPHGPEIVSTEPAPPRRGKDLRDVANSEENDYQKRREEEQRSVYVPEDPNNWNEKRREQKRYLDSEINMWKQQQRTRSPKSGLDRRRIEAELEKQATQKRRQLNQGFRQYQTQVAGLLKDYRRGRMSEQEYRAAADRLYRQWKQYKDSIIPHY